MIKVIRIYFYGRYECTTQKSKTIKGAIKRFCEKFNLTEEESKNVTAEISDDREFIV